MTKSDYKKLLDWVEAPVVLLKYRQIYIARPIVPLSNKDIGFLPGDVESKIGPYMQPLYDNLKVIQDQYKESDSKFSTIENKYTAIGPKEKIYQKNQ